MHVSKSSGTNPTHSTHTTEIDLDRDSAHLACSVDLLGYTEETTDTSGVDDALFGNAAASDTASLVEESTPRTGLGCTRHMMRKNDRAKRKSKEGREKKVRSISGHGQPRARDALGPVLLWSALAERAGVPLVDAAAGTPAATVPPSIEEVVMQHERSSSSSSSNEKGRRSQRKRFLCHSQAHDEQSRRSRQTRAHAGRRHQR